MTSSAHSPADLRRRIRFALIGLLVLAASAAVSSPAQAAETPRGSFATANCPAPAPVWKIHYTLYHRDSAGRTLNPAYQAQTLAAADGFAQRVGALSECAVKVQIDVVETDAAWPAGQDPSNVPSRPGYDAVFARVPSDGTGGGGLALSGERKVIFLTGTQTADGTNPSDLLMVHEWLHLVVGFYKPANGWPLNDVHGGCDRPDYIARDPGFGCLILPSWFSDLMLGRVMEAGVAKGLPRDQWAAQGTPLGRGLGGDDPSGEPPAAEEPVRKGTITLSARQLLINQRISQEAIYRLAVIEARLNGAPAPAKPVRVKNPKVTLSSAQLRINQRISQTAVYRAAVLLARVSNGTPPSPPRAKSGVRIDVSVAQLRISQRISQEALRRIAEIERITAGT